VCRPCVAPVDFQERASDHTENYQARGGSLKVNGGEFTVWDDRVTGFGVRVRPTGANCNVVVYRKGAGAPVRRPATTLPLAPHQPFVRVLLDGGIKTACAMTTIDHQTLNLPRGNASGNNLQISGFG
jgi:hypothetical protein